VVAGRADVGRTAQLQGVVRFDQDQQAAEEPGAFGACRAVAVEERREFVAGCAARRPGAGVSSGPAGGRPSVQAVHGAKQLPGIVEVAPPQESGAAARHAVGGLGGGAVVDDDNPSRRRRIVLGTPACGVGGPALGPVDSCHDVLPNGSKVPESATLRTGVCVRIVSRCRRDPAQPEMPRRASWLVGMIAA
jgi:hypothetical protein